MLELIAASIEIKKSSGDILAAWRLGALTGEGRSGRKAVLADLTRRSR
jgi:hypothetical protein